MGKVHHERHAKRHFSLAVSLVLVAAMFSFYLSPTSTGQYYVGGDITNRYDAPVNMQPGGSSFSGYKHAPRIVDQVPRQGVFSLTGDVGTVYERTAAHVDAHPRQILYDDMMDQEDNIDWSAPCGFVDRYDRVVCGSNNDVKCDNSIHNGCDLRTCHCMLK